MSEKMNNKEFLNHYPLEFSLPLKEARVLKICLDQASRDYSIEYTVKKDVKVGKLQYYKIEVTCEKTSFAKAYFHIGLLYAEKVLPIWQKRFEKINCKKL